MSSFYAPIENPHAIQKQVLTASKKILGVLKSYENYRKTRAEKLEYILKFKKVLDDLALCNKKLSAKMPKTSAPKAKAPEKTTQEKKNINALERELADIEKRLKTLD